MSIWAGLMIIIGMVLGLSVGMAGEPFFGVLIAGLGLTFGLLACDDPNDDDHLTGGAS